jgi:hypothetical protein
METIAYPPVPAGAPVCVACVGDRTNPDGGPCLRCKGTGTDPDSLARLDGHLGALSAALATWATRDDSKAQPEVTKARHTAADAIDAMLAELHRARQQLVGEVLEHQDAAAAASTRCSPGAGTVRGERPR